MAKQGTWRTPFGVDIKALWREGRNDWNTLQSILKEDEYGLKKLCPNPQVAIDIGGHIGGFALLAASLGAQVDVVEILPENVNMIAGSAELNGFQNQITVYPKAISGRSGEVIKAYYTPTDNEFGKHHEFVGNTTNGGGGRSFDVETISLDDLLLEYDHVDVLKIDCEGAEWPAFEGASQTTILKIQLLVGEIHPLGSRTYDDFAKLLGPEFEDISEQIGGKKGSIDLIAFRRR